MSYGTSAGPAAARCLAAAAALFALPVHAQITLDGTLGASGPLTGPNYAITAGFGRQVGSNLFHSFGRFNVHTGQSATFSGPGGIGNIIGRVTGGSASSIDGALRSTIAGANLFLINPAGMMFGPNATLDVSGSFHASTADYLGLGANGRFDARNPGASTLVAAPPAAFGFVGPSSAALSVSGSTLRAPDGKTLSLIGGNLTISNATVGTLGGRVNLAGLASAGELTPGPDGIAVTPGASLAPIDASLSVVTTGSTPGMPAGNIYIRGGSLALAGSIVRSNNSEAGSGGGIGIDLSGPLSLSGSSIVSNSFGPGTGGGVRVAAGGMTLLAGSFIETSTTMTGAGGNISVQSTAPVNISGRNGAGTRSGLYASSLQSGAAGTIALSAPELVIDDGGLIFSWAFAGGDTAGIGVNVDRLRLLDGGRIRAGTEGAGRGAEISVNAPGSVAISGRESAGVRSGITTESVDSGTSGNIIVRTGTLNIADNGEIATVNGAAGHSGNVAIDARQVEVSNTGEILTLGQGSGRSGNLSIAAAESFTLAGGADFGRVQSVARYGGNAGDIAIDAPVIAISGGSLGSVNFSGGIAGNISLAAENVAISDGGQIFITTVGAGNSGSLAINAGGSVTVSGTTARAGILTNTLAGGDAGSITINTPLLVVENTGIDTTSNTGSGRSGDVVINAGTLLLRGAGKIEASTFAGTGDSGNITVNASERIEIVSANALEGGISTSTLFSGKAGTITVRTPLLTITNGRIESANQDGLLAGSIVLEVGRLVLQGDGQIDASSSSSTGDAGNITITAGESIAIGAPRSSFGVDAITTSSSFGSAGKAGSIAITTPSLAVEGRAIASQARGTGDAGNITLNVGELVLRGGGSIDTSTDYTGAGGTILVNATGVVDIAGKIAVGDGSIVLHHSGLTTRTRGPGNAGSIVVNAPLLRVADGGGISANTEPIISRLTGIGGGIVLNVGTLEAASGGFVSANSASTSRGGNVVVNASGSVNLSGRDTGLFTRAAWSGDGGSIDLSANRVLLHDGASISASSAASGLGAGLAGTITIRAGESLQLTGGSSITTETARSDGGNIHITAHDLVHLRDSRITTSVGAEFGNGGNITIDPIFVVLDNGQIIANAFGGNGGNITIVSQFFLTTPDSVVQASSQGGGISGVITIAAPNVDLGAGLVALPGAFFDASLMMRESCAARSGHAANTFIGVGRGGLSAGPERFAFGAYSDGAVNAINAVNALDTLAADVNICHGDTIRHSRRPG